MSLDTVERLKLDFTDKYVTVDPSVAELRRFVGLTGTVKTVNMNGRALVQFDNPVDISWYDIDLSYLTVIDAPLPKPEKKEEKPAKAEKKAAPAKPAGKSPLEMARAQGAAGSAPAATGDKPLSKLELARQQAAAAKGGASAPAGGEKPLSKLEQARQQGSAGAAPAAGGKPLSKLEQARMQGAAGAAKAAPAEPAPAAEPEPAPEPVAEEAPPAAPAAPESLTDESGKPLSKLELARRQGAAKRP